MRRYYAHVFAALLVASGSQGNAQSQNAASINSTLLPQMKQALDFHDICMRALRLGFSNVFFQVSTGYQHASASLDPVLSESLNELCGDVEVVNDETAVPPYDDKLHELFYEMTTNESNHLRLWTCELGAAVSVFEVDYSKALDPIRRSCQYVSDLECIGIGVKGNDGEERNCVSGLWTGWEWNAVADTTYIIWVRFRSDISVVRVDTIPSSLPEKNTVLSSSLPGLRALTPVAVSIMVAVFAAVWT